ncbi:MAG: hypothetical protein R3B07_11540 [Polyangiaceae bacterium]
MNRFRAGIASLTALAVVSACAARPGTRSVDDQVEAPGLTVDHHIAEGTGDPKPVELLLDAGTEAAAEPEVPSETAPDPEPLSLKDQWEYTLHYVDGEVSVERVRKLIFPKPVVTDRRMGRFAIELWIGRELIDRVRFDFPMLAAEELPSGKRKPLHEPPTLAAGADVFLSVRVPASPRATRAVLIDRALGTQRSLPWPPDSPLPPVAASLKPPAAPVEKPAEAVESDAGSDASVTAEAGAEAGSKAKKTP